MNDIKFGRESLQREIGNLNDQLEVAKLKLKQKKVSKKEVKEIEEEIELKKLELKQLIAKCTHPNQFKRDRYPDWYQMVCPDCGRIEDH
ncbi:MAG: hypothetical protein LBO09_03655 [Candidatus Peribacteria bacterium]|jgi:hypothetical protein|nr:hypothetical protein [Candidatus Peribacteria bacterium]